MVCIEEIVFKTSVLLMFSFYTERFENGFILPREEAGSCSSEAMSHVPGTARLCIMGSSSKKIVMLLLLE